MGKIVNKNQQTAETIGQRDDSNTNNPVIKTKLTSDNNPITVLPSPQPSESSNTQNEAIITEDSISNLLEKGKDAERQLDDARYMVLTLESEINNGKATKENIEKLCSIRAKYAELKQQKIKVDQDIDNLKKNLNSKTDIDKKFYLTLASDQDIEDAAIFSSRG